MKLDAKVAELTKKVAEGNSSSETKQFLLWLLELQVSRELSEQSQPIYSVEYLEEEDSYSESVHCSMNDFFNIFKMITGDLAQAMRDNGVSKEDADFALKGIMQSTLREAYEPRQIH